jgi:hypothetical protein
MLSLMWRCYRSTVAWFARRGCCSKCGKFRVNNDCETCRATDELMREW